MALGCPGMDVRTMCEGCEELWHISDKAGAGCRTGEDVQVGGLIERVASCDVQGSADLELESMPCRAVPVDTRQRLHAQDEVSIR